MARFEIYQDAKLEFRWSLRANNGKLLAKSGEGFSNRANCEQAIFSMRLQVPRAVIVDRKDAGRLEHIQLTNSIRATPGE